MDRGAWQATVHGVVKRVRHFLAMNTLTFIPIHFSSLIPKDVDVHSCHLLLDHLQFTLIQGPSIPGFYAILFFTASDFTFTTRHIHNWTFSLWPSCFILSGAIINYPSKQLELYMEQRAGSKLGKEYDKAACCHPIYLTYMQNISCKTPGWMNHKLKSRLPEEISTTSDMQMIPF